jgi:hypothetical protein
MLQELSWKSFCVNICFQFSWLYTEEWNCCVIMLSLFNAFRHYQTCFPKWLQYFTYQPEMHSGCNFSTSLQKLVVNRLFDYSYPNVSEMISQCFELQYPNGKWCWTSFHVIIGPLCTFFRELFWSFVNFTCVEHLMVSQMSLCACSLSLFFFCLFL